MTVPCLTIADAVVTALNNAELSIAFTAARRYVPKFDKENISALSVQVVPTFDQREAATRSDDEAKITIDIGVARQLAARTAATEEEAEAADKAEMDALLALCEEIKALLNRQRLSGAEDAICIGTAQEIACDVEQYETNRVFLSLIKATFVTSVAV